MKVLIVDDAAANRKLLRAILEAEEMEVFESSDGMEAISVLERQDVDAIISDILMPRKDGYRLCYDVRTNERWRRLPFIIYSGTYTSHSDESLAAQLGADRFIKKPAPASVVIEALHETVRTSRNQIATLELPRELGLVKEYSERLVAKLEKKNADLEAKSQALEKTWSFNQAILDAALDCILAIDTEGRILEFNRAAEITFGFTREEVLGKQIAEVIVAPALRDQLQLFLSPYGNRHDGAVAGERLEMTAVRRAGTELRIELTISKTTGLGPDVLAIFIRDITERKRAEQQLLLQATALETAANAMVITDRDGTIRWVNPSFTTLTGYAPEEVLGKNPRILKSGQHDPEFYRDLWQTILSGKTWRGNFTNRRKDGSVYFDEQTITPVGSESGEITHFVSVMNDVTERILVEEELRATHHKLRELLTHSPAVIYSLKWEDEKIIPQVVSENMVVLLGFDVEETLQPEWWLEQLHPEDRERAIASIAETLERGESRTEYRLRRKYGGYRWVEDVRRMIYDSTGQPREFAGAWTDITEIKQLEEHLRRSQKMEAIGQLAGGIAHDFNNILGCIVGYAELARMNLSDQESLQEYLGEVLRASQRAKELIRQILTFSRQQEQERRPMRLQPVVEETLKLLRGSLPSTVHIQTDIDADTPALLGDATQMHQVIMNLATNAVYAMQGRGILGIRLAPVMLDSEFARAHPDVRDGSYVELAIRDSGSGMDRATLQRIGEPFFTTKPPGEGTGLGLAVVHGIVKGHEGLLTVESEPGKGTTFRLYVPAHESAARETRQESDMLPKGNGQLVLFVDDEEPLASWGKKMLEGLGYRVTMKTSAQEALESFRADPNAYGLVVTDLTMPGMTGVELAAELLNLEPDLPIVMATGFGAAMSSSKARALGFREHLMKPVNARSLAECLRRVLAPTKEE